VTAKAESTVSEKLVLLLVCVVGVLLAWSMFRYYLVSISFSDRIIHVVDFGVVVGTAVAATIIFVRVTALPIAARAGPTRTNTVKILFQILGLGIVASAIVLLSGPTGSNLVSALVGIGFFGIVVGLAAQETLGNVFSGLMLLGARPFNINDRIALITWQYGKFAPSLSHGWLEPAYTGVVKGITLTYTRIQTDSNAILKVPNRIVTQSLIMNLTSGRQGVISTQFEVPIRVDPEQLRKNVNTRLAKINEFKAQDESFEILEVSAVSYLVSISYRVARQTEGEMKTILLNAIRQVMIGIDEKPEK
jgi:small-conductance mechanosensitive channel